MEKDNNDNEDNDKTNQNELPFDTKQNAIMVLNALFKHGHEDLPLDIIPGMSLAEFQFKMNSALELMKAVVKEKPSVAHWLCNGLYDVNEYHIPLALLFISCYEQHPSPDQRNVECNYREIYQFLYKMTMNQPVPHLSEDSASVLYKLLSELLDEVWPNTELDILNNLGDVHIYNRSAVRRMYPGKR